MTPTESTNPLPQEAELRIRYEETTYGFSYGAAEITRLHSDDNKGWVLLQLKTPKRSLQIYVTKTGKVRIFDELDKGNELALSNPPVAPIGGSEDERD